MSSKRQNKKKSKASNVQKVIEESREKIIELLQAEAQQEQEWHKLHKEQGRKETEQR